MARGLAVTIAKLRVVHVLGIAKKVPVLIVVVVIPMTAAATAIMTLQTRRKDVTAVTYTKAVY